MVRYASPVMHMRRTATADTTIAGQRIAKGDKVAITGFGVFEKAVRPARTARNPATGASIKVPKSSVPRFRAGADFKAIVNGDKKAAAKK